MPKILEMSLEELTEVLADLAQTKVEVPYELAHERYRNLCRDAYKIVRYALDQDEVPAAFSAIFHRAVESFEGDDPIMSSRSALFLQMFDEYISQQAQQPTFNEDLIRALDIAVQRVGRALEKHHDTSTESGA